MTEAGQGAAAGLAAYPHARTDGAPGAPLVLTFHGTGGDERQFHGLAEGLVPGAHVISPRGDVSEGGHARYFRRRAEGVYDMDDLARAVEKMAGFVAAVRAETGTGRVIGIGYSNGANVLAAMAFDRPGLVDELALMHPLIPFAPEPQPGLAGRRVLITAGRRDPIAPARQTDALALWLERQGAEVALHWHPGGHEIDRSEVAALQTFLG
ncbi:MAG: alpha/beta hydrolase [Paracoccaceae bacterium]|nr:alpha/beta hydrolase [Paracoccaceae bacterium]